MFADFLGVSDVVWQALIGGLVTLILAWMAQRTKIAVERTATDAAIRVESVRMTLEEESLHQNKKLDKVVERVEEVHRATNSLTDRLVEKTGIEAHARGLLEGKKKAEESGGGSPSQVISPETTDPIFEVQRAAKEEDRGG